MFDILQQALARARAQDWFGGARAPSAAAPSQDAPIAAPLAGGAGGVAGVVSPAAETVLDEREMYYARSAAMDARWSQSPLLARAMARARGENVDELPIAPERGAPSSARPLRDPATVIAEVVAQSAPRPETAPAAPSGAGPYEEDNHRARRAELDTRTSGDGWFQRAMARARGEQVDELPITPELGAPASARPLRDPADVIAEVMAQSAPRPAAAPAAPSGAGPYEEDNYRARRAAMDAKAGSDDYFQRAMARFAARKAGGG